MSPKGFLLEEVQEESKELTHQEMR